MVTGDGKTAAEQKDTHGEFPVLYAEKIEPAQPPQEEVVYFG